MCWLLFRAASGVFAIAMIGQPVAIGFFLDGHWSALAVHQAIGISLVLVSWALAVCAVLAWWPGGGPVWIAALGLLVAVLIPLQLGMGFARVTSIHLPLGVSLVVIALVLLVSSCRRVPAPRSGPVRGRRR